MVFLQEMIDNKEILYIKQGNREIIIHTTKAKINIESTLDRLFDKWCLEELTTYKGRMEAIRKKYHLKKLVPIYINKHLMFFPTNTKKEINNIYINALNILDIVSGSENKTIIIFKNKDKLFIDKDCESINRYYQRCLKIYNLIE